MPGTVSHQLTSWRLRRLRQKDPELKATFDQNALFVCIVCNSQYFKKYKASWAPLGDLTEIERFRIGCLEDSDHVKSLL